jgi:hypothetical protein
MTLICVSIEIKYILINLYQLLEEKTRKESVLVDIRIFASQKYLDQ